VELESIAEDAESHEIFAIPDREKREAAYRLLIARIRNPVEMMGGCCGEILQPFIIDTRAVREGDPLLLDALFVMIELEAAIEETTAPDSHPDDTTAAAIAEESRAIVTAVHERLIMNMLPVLVHLQATLRDNNATGQAEFGTFFRMICVSHPSIIVAIEKEDSRLAAEIRHDLGDEEPVSEPASSILSSPAIRPRFRSRLLAGIAANTRAPIGGGGNDHSRGKQPPRRRRDSDEDVADDEDDDY
jgi:hypothetical protein